MCRGGRAIGSQCVQESYLSSRWLQKTASRRGGLLAAGGMNVASTTVDNWKGYFTGAHGRGISTISLICVTITQFS